MKCPKCHSENPSDSSFCRKCGTQILPSKEISITRTKTLQTPIVELTRGSIFAKRYDVIEELGSGGMGRVFRAVDNRIDEEVALKILNPEISADEKTIDRFRNELKFARKISHKNVCRMYDLNEEEGTQYITMEYVPGEDLKSSIKRMGQLSVGKSISVAMQICEGLTEAHRLGVVHRDIKSQNIMIDKEGNAHIMDFGIAHSLKAKGVTDTGIIVGTPEYMSPEQVEGKEVDPRSDIYSLGIILYEMLTGNVPFEGDTPLSVALKQKAEPPPDPKVKNPQIPEELRRVTLKCLEKAKEKRYKGAEEVLSELKKIERGIPTTDKILIKKKFKTQAFGKVKWKKSVLYGGIAVVLALIIAGGIYFFTGRQEAIDSVAVLPLKNLSGIPEQEFFADGMTEELISNLAQLGALQRVISSTSVMRYKGTKKPLPEIARELNVDAIVEGSVMYSEQRVRITVQLIEARTDRNLWSRSYERDLRNILSLQSELARHIAQEIKIAVTPEDQARLASARPVDPEAYQLSLRGRSYWNKRTEEGLKKAVEYFNEAIEKDPDYALAYTGLADAYNMLGSYNILPAHEAYPKAKEAAQKALNIDETLAEAYTSLALVKHRFEWDWFAAETDYNWAIGLNAGYATAHHWYGAFLRDMGRFDEGLAELERARELNPLSLPIVTTIASLFYYARQYDLAIERCKKAFEIDPDFHWAHAILAASYLRKSMFGEAITEFQKAVTHSGGSAAYLADLAHAYVVAGKRDEAQKILEELHEQSKQRYVPHYEIALVYIALGRKDQGFEYLERAYRERSSTLVRINLDPRLDSLHSDPKYITLLEKMGLE